MTQRLERNPYPIVRFKKNMAAVLYNSRSSVYDHHDKLQIKKIFRHFGPEWHDLIADEYPNGVDIGISDSEWLEDWNRKLDRFEYEGDRRKWFFEISSVRTYLRQHCGYREPS